MALNFRSEVKQGTEKQQEAGILGTVSLAMVVDEQEIANFYDIYIRRGPNGPFVAFPQRKGSDGKYYSYFRLLANDKDKYNLLCNSILSKLNTNSPPKQATPKASKPVQAKAAPVKATMPPTETEVQDSDLDFS